MNLIPSIFGDGEDEQESIIIFDLSNLAYRAYFGYEKINSEHPLTPPVSHLIGALDMLIALKNRLPLSTFYFVPDGKHSRDERCKIFPAYKAGRKPLPYPMMKSDISELTLNHLNGFFACNERAEADDIIAGLIYQNYIQTNNWEGKKIFIFSNDHDMWQLIDKNISCIAGTTETTAKEVDEKLQITPNLVILYKSFLGDASDNIPPVPRIRKKQLVRLFKHLLPSGIEEITTAEIEDIFAFLLSLQKSEDWLYLLEKKECLTQKEIIKILDHKEQVLLNFQLVTLNKQISFELFDNSATSLDPLWLQIQLEMFEDFLNNKGIDGKDFIERKGEDLLALL